MAQWLVTTAAFLIARPSLAVVSGRAARLAPLYGVLVPLPTTLLLPVIRR